MTEKIDENYFSSTFSFEQPLYYSKDEINNVRELLEDEWLDIEHSEAKTIFNILPYITDKSKILLEINNEPYCNYEMLLKWRDISYFLGEDIFTTSFLAYKDIFINKNRTDFSWKPVISTNNYRLKEILSRGTAENHFHLKGSSPHFEISWISLMNNIENRKGEFEDIQKEKSLIPDVSVSFGKRNNTLELLVKKACYIRLKLFCLINDIKLTNDSKDKTKQILLSKSINEIDFYLNEIQNNIDVLKCENIIKTLPNSKVFDYAIKNSIRFRNSNNYMQSYFSGERGLLYSVFKEVYKGNNEVLEIKDLFYAYLLIKVRFRNELIQVNNRVGFYNFSEYQNRKSYFIQDGSIYEKAIYKLAVNASLEDQNIKSLEARIAPKNDLYSLDKTIKKLDKFISINVKLILPNSLQLRFLTFMHF